MAQDKYLNIFRIQFLHDYFNDPGKPFDALKLDATAETNRFLTESGLRFRRVPDGFQIWANENGFRTAAKIVRNNTHSYEDWEQSEAVKSLNFHWSVNDAVFYNYTDGIPNFDPATHGLVLSNNGEPVVERNALRSGTNRVQIQLVPPPGRDGRKYPFPDLFGANKFPGEPGRFEHRFAVRKSVWKYHIPLSDRTREMEFRIIEQNDKLDFSQPSKVTLPDGSEVIQIASKSPYLFQQHSELRLQLEGRKISEPGTEFEAIINLLPAASPTSLRFDRGSDSYVSAIYLHL